MISLVAQIVEVERIARSRTQTYPLLVEAGCMTFQEMVADIELIQAILETLRAYEELESEPLGWEG